MNALEKLEEKIIQFKNSYDALKEENAKLTIDLENSELELLQKEEQIEAVIKKVETLLSQV